MTDATTELTATEKARKYDELARILWLWVYRGNLFQQTLGAALIREMGIAGPSGEDPESA